MVTEIRTYTPPISPELNARYRDALAKVLRWQGGTLLAATEETNLGHVDSCLHISSKIEGENPYLAQDIDFAIVNDMIYLHDAGEIITEDLCLSRPDYDAVKNGHKRREKAAMRYLTRHIDDPQTRRIVDQLARRYNQNSQTDPEALMTRLIDKIQALDFGLTHVYPSPKTNEEKVHVARAVRLIESVASPLSQIVSAGAKRELSEVVSCQWFRIKSRGFIV